MNIEGIFAAAGIVIVFLLVAGTVLGFIDWSD
jgi:hypothetical protein